eukprot:TRINITY_DN207_c0_g1_i9.p1 TRINITY_DN207_c0_g1~~TRINITY_DN207_c0_g1_i9.p1  ORF type:complete len:239 (+),score=35.04 TRINITY_DN207_c0_g1_i9:1-717(+)
MNWKQICEKFNTVDIDNVCNWSVYRGARDLDFPLAKKMFHHESLALVLREDPQKTDKVLVFQYGVEGMQNLLVVDVMTWEDYKAVECAKYSEKVGSGKASLSMIFETLSCLADNYKKCKYTFRYNNCQKFVKEVAIQLKSKMEAIDGFKQYFTQTESFLFGLFDVFLAHKEIVKSSRENYLSLSHITENYKKKLREELACICELIKRCQEEKLRIEEEISSSDELRHVLDIILGQTFP